MKKSLLVAALASLFAANAFATYIVVLRNGTTYKARSKWTVSNGKALIALENGEVLQLDPSLIDEARSEQATKSGLGDAKILASPDQPAAAQQVPSQSLGANFHLKKVNDNSSPASGLRTPSAQTPAGSPMNSEVVEKFARAYENVGIFEQNIKGLDANTLRAELTADTEDKVFNAISATSFLMVRNAGVTGVRIDMVQLFMKTTNGGSSGRFEMTRADAEAIDAKKMTQQDYFVRHVIF